MIADKDEHLEEVIKYCQDKFGWVNTSSLTLYQIEMIDEVIKAVKNIAVLDGVSGCKENNLYCLDEHVQCDEWCGNTDCG